MAFIAAVDPGAKNHGFCLYNSKTKKVIRAYETSHMIHIAKDLDSLQRREQLDVVVVEDFIGGGQRDANVTGALRMVGFVEGFARFLGVEVAIQAPQIRKPFLHQAGLIVGAGHHYTDATAHALAYAELHERNYRGSKKSRIHSRARTEAWGNPEDLRNVPEGATEDGVLESTG